MAQKIEKQRIYVSNVTVNGVLCANPTIEFDETCFTVSCEGTDSQGRKYIEVTPLEGCDKQCIDVATSCPNECEVDECSTVKRYCFCETAEDCDSCSTCENGFCVDNCPDGICVEDECKECITAEDCPCNLVCTLGKCVCPAGLIYDPKTGCCEECIEECTDPCEICIDGHCQPKCDGPCKDGECVPCVNSGDCVGRPDNRACCGPDGCECCAGYCYDPIQGKCVPCPDCTEDSDCPACHICVAGECVPIVCPEGHICVDDECVPICDCDNPVCSRKAACVPYSGDTCICVECEGNCEDGCSIGCYCNPETNQCEPNPCDKPCSSGADCGQGCGCDPDTNRCVPCESLNCETDDCDRVEGCKCYGSTCIGDPCNGPCEDGNDCDGPNCGCDQDTNTCVSCDKLSCDECANVLGCECTNGVNCEPVTPCSGPCAKPSDCPNGCTCYEGECTPCANFDCDNCPNGCDCNSGSCGKSDEPETCEDVFTLEKDSEDGEPCDLIATLVTDECCSCPKIEVRSQLKSPVSDTTVDLLGNTVTGKKLTYNVQLFKNGIRLSNTGIINELPTSGTFEAAIDVSYRLVSGGVPTSGTITNYATVTGDISGADNIDLPQLSVPNTGVLINNGTTELEVTGVSIRITLTEDLIFPNECVYDAVETVATYTDYQIGIIKSYELATDECRLPIFDWYRNATGSGFGSGNRFRRVYAERVSANTYRDIIRDCSDGLYSGFYYRVTSDCTCATAPVEQALFCQDVLNFDYTLSECGTKLTVDNIDSPCDVNGDLTAQGCTNIPAGAQVTWKLRITTTDGIEVNNDYTLPNANLTVGTMFTTTGQILLVEFIKSDDNSCKIVEAESGGIDFDVVGDCADGGMITVYLPATGSYNIVINDGVSNVASRNSVNGTQDFTGLGYGGTFTVTVTDGTCTGEKIVGIPTEATCCDTYTCSAVYNGTSVSIAVSPINGSLTYSYTVDGNPYVLGTPISLTNGTHTYTVTDSNGCGCSGTFEVDNCPEVTINANRSFDASTNTVSITNITGGTPNYTINIGGIIATNVTAIGTTINVAALPDGNYTVTITDSEGCIGTFSLEINRPDPCLDSNLSIAYTPAEYDCENDEMLITVSGGTAPYTLVVEDNFGPIGGALQDLGSGNYRVFGLTDNTYTATATDDDGCVKVRTFVVDCNCNNPIIIDTISADCDGNDHVISIPGGVTGGDSSPLVLRISDTPGCSGGTTFWDNTVVSGAPIEVTIPEASALSAGSDYYICAQDIEGKCTAEDSVQAPDCDFSCEYSLGTPVCAGDGANVWFAINPIVVGGTNNCTILGGTVTVDSATINGSAANVTSAVYTGGQLVIVPDQSLMCPTQSVTEIAVQITIGTVFGAGCECIDETPIVVTKTFEAGDIPNCEGSCV